MKLLIVKANQLGDNVVFLPVIQELIRRSGSENIHVLTSPIAADLYRDLLPARNLWVEPTSEVLNAWKKPGYFLKLWKRWRKIAPDAVLLSFDQGNVPRMLARLAGTAIRIGAINPRTKTNWCLSHRIELAADRSVTEREWETGRRFAREVGLDRRNNPWPSRSSRPDLSHVVGKDLPVRERIFIHAGASDQNRGWPLRRFVELANSLSDKYEVCWSKLGVEEERHLGPWVVMVPKLRLAEFTKEVAGSCLFVGNNSGPMHLAAAAGVPTISFPGPTPRAWDAKWDTGAHLMFRSRKLKCQPCAGLNHWNGQCRNLAEPMKCLGGWNVGEVERVIQKHWERKGVPRLEASEEAQIITA